MAQQGTAARSKEEREAIIKVTNFMDSSCTSMLVCVCVCARVCVYNGIYELSEITFALLGVAYVCRSQWPVASSGQICKGKILKMNYIWYVHNCVRTYSKRHGQQKVQEPKCIFHVGAKTCSGLGAQIAQEYGCVGAWVSVHLHIADGEYTYRADLSVHSTRWDFLYPAYYVVCEVCWNCQQECQFADKYTFYIFISRVRDFVFNTKSQLKM